jgi:predicted metalloprotease with PDZ domain
VAKNVNLVLNTAGIDTQTLAEASFDTWLKYYRKNENTNNTQISYYNKGAVVAMIFDFIILDVTNGEKCLDDVLRKLYSDYISNPNLGITESSLLATFQSVSNFDFTAHFKKYIHSTEPFNVESYFELIGIDTKEEKRNEIHLGLTTSWKEGQLRITELDKNYGAYQSGLNVNDEIIAIDGFRATKDFTKIYEHKKINDYIDVLISRQGIIKTYKTTLTPNRQRNVSFAVAEKKSPKQTALLNKWLQRNEN